MDLMCRFVGIVCAWLLPGCLIACSGEDGSLTNSGAVSVSIEPSAAYRARQSEYLAYCSENNVPDPNSPGGIHGQVCRAAAGEATFDEDAIQASLAKIDAREDTADFDFNSVIRILWIDRLHPVLPQSLRERMVQSVLGFKYWLQEPGPSEMCWWSENHQILFHTAELLAGQLLPEGVFTNSGMTGREHVEHATGLVNRWLDLRGRFGFSEWHSNVYFDEDIPALVNLVDFAEDEAIRVTAAMVLDEMALDMASNYFQGWFATTRGRTYQRRLGQGQSDSTREAAYVLLGLGGYESPGNFGAAFLASSGRYAAPEVLEAIARDAAPRLEHRQHDSINIVDGPSYGIGYEEEQDVLFWWGAEGYVDPRVIDGTFKVVDDNDLWEGYLWNELRFLKVFVGSPMPRFVAESLLPMSRGVALEGVDTYTYRTPDYQLSGAQDYKPAMWAGQVQVWQATLGKDAYVFTSYPGGLEGDYMAGPWTGGWLPRATFHRNVGIIQYGRPRIPVLDQLLFTDYSHAFFPQTAFDELVQERRWTIGRKGDAYLALYSQHPTVWSAANNYELIAHARENVWIVELGDAGTNGTFADFVKAIRSARVEIRDTVSYQSPSLGPVVVGWEGPMTVSGKAVDLGPYGRWDNPYCRQAFGTNETIIEFGDRRLELDFAEPARRYIETRQ